MKKAKAKKVVKAAKKANGAVKKVAAVKKEKPNYTAIIAGLKKGNVPEKSGELIRARIMEAKSTPEQIVAEVKKRFKGSTTKVGDVYWNRGKLKADGFKVPEVVHAE